MRWEHPKSGTTRVIKKFLWLPLMLDNETRWLETVEIKQVYRHYATESYEFGGWENVCFNDKAAVSN